MEHHQAMGWGEWPHPVHNAVQPAEEVPPLIPIHPNDDPIAEQLEPVEEILQAEVNQVATPDQAPEGQVLAMDEITVSSEDETPPQPPLEKPVVDVPDFLKLQNFEAFQVEEVQIQDSVDFNDLQN